MTILSGFRKLTKTDARVTFKALDSESPNLFALLKANFSEKIEPLYGDQTAILQKTKNSIDRSCEFLFHQEKASGVIIYKTQASDEFTEFQINNGIELKTILLIQKNTKTAGLFLKHLLTRVAKQAIKVNANCIFGTVSSKKPEVLKVLCKLGFHVVTSFHGKYIEGVDEYLICHPHPSSLLIKENLPDSLKQSGLLLC